MSGHGHARMIDALRYAKEARQAWSDQALARQRKAVELYCAGLCIKRICAEVGVATATANRYLKDYMVAHRISNRAQLGVHFKTHGYVS